MSAEERLITALDSLSDKIESMSGQLGRGTNKNKTSQVPGGKTGSPEEKAAAKSFNGLDKLLKEGIITQKDLNKANEKQTDAVQDLTKSQKSATEEQKKLERSMERAKNGFTGFGKSLFNEKTNVADALGSLGTTLSHGTGIVGRIFGGMASGVGLALGLMQNFADSAREMGSFADLGAFQLGSVRQAKVLSGLGDSFIKVIEQSNGGFKGLGGTSQQAVENLSNLSRSFRYGSSSLTSTMKKSLGTDLIKTVDKTSNAIAAMGLSQAEQATLEASILSTTMMTAKNEDDAKKKFVIAMGQSTTSARGLSDTFGMSAKKINEAMAEFRGTQAGKVAALSGGVGGAEFFSYLKEHMSSFTSNPEELANLSSAIAEGNMSKAQKAISSNPYATESMQRTFRAAQGTITDKGFDAEQFGKNLQQERGAAEAQYAGVKDQQGFNDKLVAPVLNEMLMFKKMDISTGLIKPDAKAKPEIKTSELQNIESMNSLTAALESLRGTLLGVSASILGLTGAIGGLVLAGGLGALAAGGTLGKIGSAVGGMFGGKGSGPAGGIAGKAGGIAGGIGEKAGGMFSKLGGAASSGMSSFGDFLGKLGDSKTIKGAGTLAILGGALALAAHGFKTFNEVNWPSLVKGTLALGALVAMARLVGEATTGIIKGAGAIAILGAAVTLSAVGFKTFNDVNWESLIKGAGAIAILGVSAQLLGKMTSSILIGAVGIAALGAAMWVAGKGFASFNDVEWDSVAKGAVALGVLGVVAVALGVAAPALLFGSLAIAALGAAMWVAGKGFASFNEVEWDSTMKGAVALGVLGVTLVALSPALAIMAIASIPLIAFGAGLAIFAMGVKQFNEVNWGSIPKALTALVGLAFGILLISPALAIMAIASIPLLAFGAALSMFAVGVGMFNDVDWGSTFKGALAIGVLGIAIAGIGLLAPGIIAGSIALGIMAIAVGALGVAMIPAAYATRIFADAFKTIGDIDGANLIAVGAGLAAIGFGMIAFTAGMIAGTAGSVITGIMSLFGAKSPLDRIKDFVPYADKISILGAGIKAFGEGVTAIAANVASFDTDALGKLKDKLLEFAAAGSSDEVKLTAEYLASIGTSLGTIANIGELKLPSTSSMGSSPSVSTDIGSSLSPGESVVNDKSSSSLTPEAIAQLMSYLSSMQNDLAAIRGNTKSDGFTAPVRLS